MKFLITMNQKYLFLLLFCINTVFCFSKNQDNLPIIEKIAFEEDFPYSLKGTMYLPNQSKPKKIAIFITSVWYDLEPDFTSTLDTLSNTRKYIQYLTDNNNGVLLLNRGNYFQVKEKNLPLSIKTVVSDTEKALRYLKIEEKYAKLPVGVMGASETGCAASIIASQNEDIAFTILISTPGVTGLEENEYDKNSMHSPWQLPLFYTEIFQDSVYFFNKEKFIVRKKTGFDSLMYNNFYRGIIDAERQAISIHENYDSIVIYTGNLFHEKWEGTSMKSFYTKDQKMGNLSNKEFSIFLAKALLTPRHIEFSKWDPQLYFPKIKCPVLMLYGEKDININLKTGIDSVKQIINDYHLNNFTLKLYEGLEHSLYSKMEKRKEGLYKGKLFPVASVPNYVCEDIINWLNKIPE